MDSKAPKELFVVRGLQLRLSADDVESAFESTTEDQWSNRPGIEPYWHVVVGNASKPLKAVFRNLPGVPSDFAHFTTNDAIRPFQRLGFTVTDITQNPNPQPLYLLGTWNNVDDEAIQKVRATIRVNGSWASWWSFPIREDAQKALTLPFYLYLNAGANRIPYRAKVEDFRTSFGNDGIKTPWPEITDAEAIGLTRAGDKTSEIFKTWLKITDVEELSPSLTRSDFTPALGTGVSALLNQSSFGYAYRRSTDGESQEQMLRTGAAGDSIQSGLERIMANYVSARTSEEFSGGHPLTESFSAIQTTLERASAVRQHPTIRVRWSAGKGNWTNVPWIALLDDRETHTTQKGVYCVFLFKQDMSGVYLTFNQGVTEPRNQFGRAEARRVLAKRATSIRAEAEILRSHGFFLDDRIDLRVERGLGIDYEKSTIAYKLYEAGRVPSDEAILGDVSAALEVYGQYLKNKPMAEDGIAVRYWIFQANPAMFNTRAAVNDLDEMSWLVQQHRENMRAGDKVYLWESGPEAGIVGTAEIISAPELRLLTDRETKYVIASDKLGGIQPRVTLRIDRRLSHPILRRDLLDLPGLRTLSILRAPQGTNFPVSAPEAEILDDLLDQPRPGEVQPQLDLSAVHQSFGESLLNSHLSFGIRHLDFTRSFVASLATKQFIILTGLSGSGKTQIALRFGEWCGEDNVRIVPVRPDWTGAEAVFGYEDALLPVVDGRRAWHVPEALEFMLKAATDPGRPYVLILDEMNLAHVERYFADVLSGMESGVDCLPNLIQEGGIWYPESEASKIHFPENLFVIGTVNVDETTYMFSPKVLDRANTMEFRVAAADFSTDAHKPTPSEPGPVALVRGFLAIARDNDFHLTNPHPDQTKIETALKQLHTLLSEGGFEFGHRVFYEIMRFAAMYNAAGVDRWVEALDLQILQKILPRLHGSRRGLEPTLDAMAQFCISSSEAEEHTVTTTEQTVAGDLPNVLARFPLSLNKVRRMTRNVRANQFASFTD